ncbi:hypothetical protein E8E11_008418 [Didymella keratinophila]|nr:hypothetical protein E8E11_008418 [Didymella keratinophila]
MRSKADWQPAQPGVMLYMPATRVSIEDTEHSMYRLSVIDGSSQGGQSQLSNIGHTILQSCEHGPIQIKEEPTELAMLDVVRDDSPDTLRGDMEEEEVLSDVSPAAKLTPESSVGSDFLFQLMEAAHSNFTRSDIPYITTATDSDAIATTEDFLSTCHDSDRTDFRESPSPSMRKPKKVLKRKTGAVSRHFKRQTQLNILQPPMRRLNFGNKLKKQASKKGKKSAYAQSLEDLANIESAPSHNWDEDERELLCVLNRWYCGRDRAAELDIFAKVFNSITGLDILPKRVRIQFENHLRLYGAEAYPVFGRVFSTPFDDPEGRYAKIRDLIEAEAVTLGLELQQREFEVVVRSGTAKFAKSPKTRKFYKSLVRRASQGAVRQANQDVVYEEATRSSVSVPTISGAVCVPTEGDLEILTNVEESTASVAHQRATPVLESVGMPEAASTRPHLTFRVWDAANRTKFIDGSFVAQTFVDWPRPFPAPIALEDPSEAGKILTVLHLSRQGDTPVYISTASSLLQAMSYAMNMQRPQIAMIDLDTPSLQQPHKVHHAAEIFPWLKSQGLARWARYKGNGEYFVWAEIPDHAVLCTVDLEGLIRELDNDVDCNDLLNFDVFKPDTKTNTIAGALREKNVMLNTSSARALGKTAKMFGMDQHNVTLDHLQDFVARLVDGWTITKPEMIDVHTMSSLASTFATALSPHSGGYGLQQVMGAFIEGVDQGTRCIAHWSRSRSGSRRQRFRDA